MQRDSYGHTLRAASTRSAMHEWNRLRGGASKLVTRVAWFLRKVQAHHTSEEKPVPVPPVDGSSHILIIEDDAAVGDMLTLLLESEGYRATWCSSASAALALLTSAPPDASHGLAAPHPNLIILDLELGPDSGVALIQRIAAAPRAVPPIIVVSGVDGVAARAAATTVGAVAVLRKPFVPTDLLTAITSALPNADAAPDPDQR